MAHIVHSSICRYLEENNILTPRQHGFRSGHSCETQLILAIDDWTKALDTRLRTDITIFDFSKVFDSVPHRRLLAKIESYGIKTALLAGSSRSYLAEVNELLLMDPSLPGCP